MERIGEFLVRKLIGEGGMGKVYEAEERLSKRRVALKVLRPELGRSEKGRELFLNEMTILAHFDHPNIVRCLSCSELEGELVMALEYLEGQTLRDRLVENTRMSWSDAVEIVVQVASALEATHGQEPPIIHRDLKPENLMLIEDDQVKVMDFGIATAMHAMSMSTAHSVGTLQYMSPEQIDAASVDARSDIYCLGLIFYEMLVGHPPFESESPRELLNLQCTSAPPPLPDDIRSQIPKGVERVLFTMLEKSPDKRPSSASEIIRAFEPFASAAPRSNAAPHKEAASESTDIAKADTQRDVDRTRESGSAKGDGKITNNLAAASKSTPRSDTIALLEKAAAPREISMGWALTALAVLFLVTGVFTYVLRVKKGDTPAVSEPLPAQELVPGASEAFPGSAPQDAPASRVGLSK